MRSIAVPAAAVLLLVGGCAAEEEITGDPLANTSGKEDGWWKPERDLEVSSARFGIFADQPGQAFAGTFDPAVYGAAIFEADANTPVMVFTRSWLESEWETPRWDTYPYLFVWAGADDGDVNDWDNWSLVDYGRNNYVYQLAQKATYLVTVMTTEHGYADGADYVAYLAHGDAAIAQSKAGVHGILVCGDSQRPLPGIELVVESSSERIRSGSDGSFAFAETYPLGRANIWAKVASNDLRYFDAVITPLDQPMRLVMNDCP